MYIMSMQNQVQWGNDHALVVGMKWQISDIWLSKRILEDEK